MAGLQRSEISFRRQGSSGLVWDDKLVSGELNKISTKTEDESKPSVVQRSRSTGGGGGGRGYRAANVEPSADPPSPKVSGCCASVFGKTSKSQQPHRKSGGRRKS